MTIQKVWAVYFSPAGTTERTARTIAAALGKALGAETEEISLTLPGERNREYAFSKTDLVVAASPTYAGKLPNKILPAWKSILRSAGAIAVPVVLFGGRAYDNALAELAAVLTEDGFCPVAAAAFASRHAFTDALGDGRPDWEDQREMEDFARAAAEKVLQLSDPPVPVAVPGDPAAPYYIPRGIDGEPARFLKAKPRTDLSRCCRCGVCARRCPMGAIDETDPSQTPGTCIKCHSCVRRCTRKAKYFDDPAFLSHVAMLEKHFTERKPNAVFLSP